MNIIRKKVLEVIDNVIPSDKKIVLIDVYDKDSGEVFESGVPIFKNEIKKKVAINKRPHETYVSTSTSKRIKDDYFSHFTRSEKGYLFDLFLNVDAFGRIKYGDNYQQYCRTQEDLAKVLGVSYETIRKTLIKKLKHYDLIRVIEIQKGHEFANEQYISFNPAVMTNGVEWDRWTVLCWKDVIEKYELLSSKEINRIINNERTRW